jgi:hypothetical protein
VDGRSRVKPPRASRAREDGVRGDGSGDADGFFFFLPFEDMAAAVPASFWGWLELKKFYCREWPRTISAVAMHKKLCQFLSQFSEVKQLRAISEVAWPR